MPSSDPRVDAYIAKALPFARPILQHLRAAVHRTCPDVEETIKWGFPHFMYHDAILCSMASFKAHAVFGFWRGPQLTGVAGRDGEAMGDFGRILSKKDLPADRTLGALIRAAMKLNEAGVKRPARKAAPRRGRPRPSARAPKDLAAALKSVRAATLEWARFTPSGRREYVEWITEAKTATTRARRVAQALEWIAEGKHRNWKYMRRTA